MEDLGKSILATSLLIKHHMDVLAGKYKLKSTQARILSRIYKDKNVTIKSIEKDLNITKSTISEHVKSLTNIGYVQVIPSSVDKRKINLVLTDVGLDVFHKLNGDFFAFEKQLKNLFSKEENKEIIRLLEIIKCNLREE